MTGGPESRLEYLVHNGRRIMHIDHTTVTGLPDIKMAREFFARAREEICAQPPNSVRMLTSVSPGMRFNLDITTLEREFSRAVTPYVMKSAAVGVTTMMQAVIATLRFFTGRDIRTFETTTEALDWLAE